MYAFHYYFITLRNGCDFEHYAHVNLLEEQIPASHTKSCLSVFLLRYSLLLL